MVQTQLTPLPHLHKELEMIFVERGNAQAFADKKCYEIKQGDIFLSFPNQVHYYKNVSVGKYYVIIFSADVLFGIKNLLFDNILRTSVVSYDASHTLKELTKQLSKVSNDNTNPYIQTVQAGILNQIMAIILNNCELKPRVKSDNTTLIKILKFCEQNLQNDLTLDILADSLHLNKYYISHLLNKKIGIGLNSYVNSLRIKNACDLLADTTMNSSDISEEVGFGSIRSFNRAFNDIMNTTPTEYRNQIKTGGKQM